MKKTSNLKIMKNLIDDKSYGWWMYLLSNVFLTTQVMLNDVPGDSRVFFQAGLNVRNNVNPWIESSDSVNFQFLNGPIFSVICFILSFAGLRAMYLLTCILSIAITPMCVFLASRLLKIKTDTNYLGLMSALFMLTFSFRANLEYGQFVIIYFLLFLCVLRIHTSENISRFQQVLIGIGIVVLIDFKPHIFIFMFCLLFQKKSNYLRIGFLVGCLIEILVLKLVSGDFLPYEWINRLSNRGQNSGGFAGYYNLPNLMSELLIPDSWNKYLVPVIFLILFSISIRFSKSVWIRCIIVFLAFNPLMHSQDFLPLILFTLIAISQDRRSIFTYLILGLSFVWSTSLIVIFFCCAVVSFSLFFLHPLERSIRAMIGLCVCVSPLFLIHWAEIFQIGPDAYRVISNIVSVVGMYVILSKGSKLVGISNFVRDDS